MASKKVAKKVNAKAVVELKALHVAYEIADGLLSKTKELVDANLKFRAVSVAMFKSLNGKTKVFKNQSELVRLTKIDKNTISRYVKAGKFLSVTTDVQLAKRDLTPTIVKAKVKSLNAEFAKATNGKSGAKAVDALAAAKAPDTKTVQTVTISGAVNCLMFNIQNNVNLELVKTIQTELNKLQLELTKRLATSATQKAMVNLVK